MAFTTQTMEGEGEKVEPKLPNVFKFVSSKKFEEWLDFLTIEKDKKTNVSGILLNEDGSLKGSFHVEEGKIVCYLNE